jgi:3-hydroxyacyl-[acyl-carrier-protein] dehydratase
MMKFPINPKDLIPHRSTMLLLDTLCFSSPDFMEGETVVQPGNIFLSSRGLDGTCFVELLAQLAAAGDGCELIKSGKPVRSGFLVGVTDFTVSEKAVVGDLLQLKLRKEQQLENFIILEGDVCRGTALLAKGTLKIYVTDNPSGLKYSSENGSPARDAAESGYETKSPLPEQVLNAISEVESAENGNVRAKVRFPRDFLALRGHFPGHPVVPGVMLFSLAVLLAEKARACPVILTEVTWAKFSRQVVPGDALAADLSVLGNDDRFTIKAALTIEGKPAASFLLKARKDL